jgi:hypothetical protein
MPAKRKKTASRRTLPARSKEESMSNQVSPKEGRIDQFFSGPGARADRWRDLQDAARGWAAGTARCETPPRATTHARPPA